MTYHQESKEAFMGGGVLYRFIENDWDLRLSGAEKMLIRQSLEGVWAGDGNPIPTCLDVLQKFRFDSVLFRARLARTGKSTIRVYESMGRRK